MSMTSIAETNGTYVSVGESLLASRCLSTNRAATVLESSPNPYRPATAAMGQHRVRRHRLRRRHYNDCRDVFFGVSSFASPPPSTGSRERFATVAERFALLSLSTKECYTDARSRPLADVKPAYESRGVYRERVATA